MQQICKITSQEFEITDDDIKFYEKIGVPPPTLCPEERMRRRLAWRNERNLYHRVCDGSGKKIISMYSQDKPFPVYENDYWWSDNWDSIDYGQDFNVNQPFLEQFIKLFNKVPKMARIQQGENENSTYCNCASWNKNSYLLFASDGCEDSFYGNLNLNCRDCADCSVAARNELCYESINMGNDYNCIFSFALENCTDCAFCKECVGCKDCIGCINLHNKQYCIVNIQYSKEEYEQKKQELNLKKYSALQNLRKYFSDFFKTKPHRFMEGIQNEGQYSGNVVYFSKNTENSFDVEHLEDCKFCNDAVNLKTSYDVNFYGATETNELLYECEGVGHGVFNVRFSKLIWGGCANIDYCYECFNCKDCFGCTGLKKAQYCILNKQYSKEEYFELREKIIGQLKESNVWGEFFPIKLSPFAYNETVAQEYFPIKKNVGVPLVGTQSGNHKGLPLQKHQILHFKYTWKDSEPGAKYNGPKIQIPETITETSDDICNQILECETCSKNYRIVKPELAFYRKMKLPVPRSCPDCRHKARMALRNPRKLWKRNCDNCSAEIETTFAPERPERVYCEKCYLDAVQ